MPTVEHRGRKDLKNRADNFHLPLRKREGMTLECKSFCGLHWCEVSNKRREVGDSGQADATMFRIAMQSASKPSLAPGLIYRARSQECTICGSIRRVTSTPACFNLSA
jgi:hypothetical protein